MRTPFSDESAPDRLAFFWPPLPAGASRRVDAFQLDLSSVESFCAKRQPSMPVTWPPESFDAAIPVGGLGVANPEQDAERNGVRHRDLSYLRMLRAQRIEADAGRD